MNLRLSAALCARKARRLVARVLALDLCRRRLHLATFGRRADALAFVVPFRLAVRRALAATVRAWMLRRNSYGLDRCFEAVCRLCVIAIAIAARHQVIRTLYVSLSLSAVVLLTGVKVARMSAEPPGEVF